MNYNIIKFFDLFGEVFNFYFERKNKLYTIEGGIISILVSILLIFLFIVIDINILNKNNPTISTYEYIRDKNNQCNIYNNIIIPFALLDQDECANNFNNSIYADLYLHSLAKTEKGKIKKNKEKISFQKCNETILNKIKNNLSIKTEFIEDLYCVDLNQIKIINNEDTYSYIEIQLNYNNKLNINLNNYIFRLLYPIFQFNPNNTTNPIFLVYESNDIYLSSKFYNKKLLFMKEYILNDYSNFISKKSQYKSFIAKYKIESESYFIETLFSNNNDSNKDINMMSVEIHLEDNIKIINRKFNNIIDSLSISIPLLWLIYKILECFIVLNKKAIINQKLIELLFENTTNKEYKNTSTKKIINNSDLRRNNNLIKKTIQPMKNNYFDGLNFSNKKYREDKENSKEPIKENNQTKYFSTAQKSDNIIDNIGMEKRTSCILNLNLYKEYKNKINNDEEKNIYIYKTKLLFPKEYYFCSVLAKNLIIKEENRIFSKKFIKVFNFISYLFDIKTYITFQKEFNILKEQFLDEESIKYVESYKKININNKSFIKDMTNYLYKIQSPSRKQSKII